MSRAAAMLPPAGDDPSALIDVWSRTAPKYRRRAALLLGVTLVLFAGLCCFTFWLRTGQYGPWEDPAYYAELMAKSFNTRSPDQVTLIQFLLFPISVEQVPIQWVIIGLLLASLASIPILVAILYRFPASIVFAAMVSGLAAMPWLGLTILLGCAIASLRPLRLSFRYASALLGLIPVAIYFVTATRDPGASLVMTPFRAKLAAPWVLAALGSCVICAIALAIAKLINYRPGGIAPLLAVLFAAPVVLFHAYVGRDELEYRILEDRVGPGSQYLFVNRSLADEARQAATERWAERGGVSLNELRDRMLEQRTRAAFVEEANERAEAVQRCDAFLLRFRESRYAPNVLYLKGRALDLRIDEHLLANGLLTYVPNLPRPGSRGVWQALCERFPESDLAAFGLHQQAMLEASFGRLDEALMLLDRLIERFGQPVTATQPARADEPAGLFGRPRPTSSLGFDPATVLPPARRLAELIRVTRGDPVFGDEPLRRLLALNDRGADYAANAAALLCRYRGALIEPHLCVRLAARLTSRRAAIDVLEKLAAADTAPAARAEALYYLGRQHESAGDLAAARVCFDRLLSLCPQSSFAPDARERRTAITMLEPLPTAAPRPG